MVNVERLAFLMDWYWWTVAFALLVVSSVLSEKTKNMLLSFIPGIGGITIFFLIIYYILHESGVGSWVTYFILVVFPVVGIVGLYSNHMGLVRPHGDNKE